MQSTDKALSRVPQRPVDLNLGQGFERVLCLLQLAKEVRARLLQLRQDPVEPGHVPVEERQAGVVVRVRGGKGREVQRRIRSPLPQQLLKKFAQ